MSTPSSVQAETGTPSIDKPSKKRVIVDFSFADNGSAPGYLDGQTDPALAQLVMAACPAGISGWSGMENIARMAGLGAMAGGANDASNIDDAVDASAIDASSHFDMGAPTSDQGMTEDDALTSLAKHFDSLADPTTHLISTSTLLRAARGSFASDIGAGAAVETAASAQYFIDHPGDLHSLETAQGVASQNAAWATADNLISAADIAAEQEQWQSSLASDEEISVVDAVDTLSENFSLLVDPQTNLISTETLLRAARGDIYGDASYLQISRLQAAAQFMIDHPEALTSLETAHGRLVGNATWATADDYISAGDLQVEAARLHGE